jgi:hypothetical protein
VALRKMVVGKMGMGKMVMGKMALAKFNLRKVLKLKNVRGMWTLGKKEICKWQSGKDIKKNSIQESVTLKSGMWENNI